MSPLDELDRVCGSAVLMSPPRGIGGGEWDYLVGLPLRTVRRLVGAGFMSRGGERPDVLADLIAAAVPDVESTCDAMAWYVGMASAAVIERRRIQHRRRHARYARQLGFVSYYDMRRSIALEHGHGSFYYMRKDRGWL